MTVHCHAFWTAIASTIAAIVVSAPAAEPFAYAPLDDFEDASPWVKGDPRTDLAQRDAAVAGSTDVVKQGKQSLSFMIRVNWTKRPTETYAKGWPMMQRTFKAPRDWEDYDAISFWLFTRTKAKLLQERVLRVGFPDASGTRSRLDWYTIPGIKPGAWQKVTVPKTLDVDWSKVQGISFYVAEGWYQDGDKIDFFVDDMQLVKRTVPMLASVDICSRILPRGTGVVLNSTCEGPWRGTRLRVTVSGPDGRVQWSATQPTTGKKQRVLLTTQALPPGGHQARVELLSADQTVIDAREQYFRSTEAGKRSYLKLITFYTKPVMQCKAEELKILNGSAYAGVAIPLCGSYETDDTPAFETYAGQMGMIRKTLTIDPWPWIAINRMIGAPADGSGHAHKHAKAVERFTSIKGMDFRNETGAHANFMRSWRNAVRMAREWKSPGVMIDLEAYNNYRTYSVPYVADQRGESIDTVIAHCETLGANMADVVAEEYPGCVIWSLFSRLERTITPPGTKTPLFTVPSYITLGILKRAKAQGIDLKYLCGGETTPGYCNRDVAALKEKIAKRDRDVAPILAEFPERFFLAGTISPFHDYSITKSFIEKGYADSPIRSLAEFQPMFRTLFDAYDWVWIYASSSAQTLPYNEKNSRMYAEVLNAALGASVRGK